MTRSFGLDAPLALEAFKTAAENRVRVSAPVSAEAGIRHRPFVPAVSFHIKFDRPGTSHCRGGPKQLSAATVA